MNDHDFYTTVAFNEETAMNYAKDNGLIGTDTNCDECHNPMMIDKRKQGKGRDRFICRRKALHGDGKRITKSMTKASLIKSSHLSIQQILILIHCFAYKKTFEDAMTQTRINSTTTIARYFKCIRKSIIEEMSKRHSVLKKIGGKYNLTIPNLTNN